MKYLIVLIITVLFFSGCSQHNETYLKTIDKEPLWLKSMKKLDGEISSVSCASRHINGEDAQKKLALKRAIDEIAMQINSDVKVTSYSKRKISGSLKSSSHEKQSLHQANVENIKTKIIDWHKRNNGDICVYVQKQ